MGIITWIIFGALVGWIASMFAGTNSQQGVVLNIIVGIVGAVLGGWIMTFFNGSGVTGFNVYSFVVAIVGAVIFISILKMVRRV